MRQRSRDDSSHRSTCQLLAAGGDGGDNFRSLVWPIGLNWRWSRGVWHTGGGWKKAKRVRGVPVAVGWTCVAPCPTAFSIGWFVSSGWYPIAAGVAESAFIVLTGRKGSRSNRHLRAVTVRERLLADSSERLCPHSPQPHTGAPYPPAFPGGAARNHWPPDSSAPVPATYFSIARRR